MIRTLLGKKFPTSRWALSIGLGSSLAALGAAHAQTPAAGTGETQEVERVVVTGSNIPTAAEVGAAPVTTVDAAAIGRTGTDDPQVVLQKSDPSFTGGGTIGQNNSSVASNSTQGGSAVSLRGLQTLVLLNGRRIADSAAVASGGLQFQDVNLFPTALIKRIEVLKDGASAIYGSDAVGGVVNVLLNDDFQGFAVTGRYGFAEKGDIHDDRVSGVAGFGDDKTRIVVAAQYQENDPIFTRQRDFAKTKFDPLTGFTTTSSNFGGLVSIGGATVRLNTGLTNPAVPNTPALLYNSPSDVVAGGSIAPIFNPTTGQQIFSATQLPAGVYTAGAGGGALAPSSLNLNQFTGLTNDASRLSAYGSVERDIFEKHLTIFADFLYAKNYAQSYLAPQPVTTGSSPLTSQNMIIPLGAPFNPFNSEIGQDQASQAGGIKVTNRFTGAPRIFREDTNFYRIVAGLKGEIVKDYNYELAFNHSEDEVFVKNFNYVRSDLVDEALAGGYNADGTAAPATFTTIANPVTGAPVTVVATPAGKYSRVDGALVPALDAFAFNNPLATTRSILGTVEDDQQSKLTVVDGKVTAFPFNLPAGPVGVALGGEYRDEELRLNVSVQNTVAGVPVGDVEVSRGIEAGFVEISIPVISPTMKVPGVYSLDLDGAGRVEKYDNISSNWVPKASFVYRPIIDVAIRGTYGKSFNVPNLIETNGPPSSGFTSLVPLGAPFSEQGNAVTTSNPNLGPLRTDTVDAGIVLSPHQVPGLTISGDFFHVEQKGLISSDAGAGATTILQSVNLLGAASPYNSSLHFGSATGPNLTAAAVKGPYGYIGGNAANYYVVSSIINRGRLRESGVDFTINYDHDFGPKFGGITLGLNGTYYLQFKTNDDLGGENFDNINLYGAGTVTGIGGQLVPQYKLVPYVEYRYGGASVSALMNYLPSNRDTALLGTTLANDYVQKGDGDPADKAFFPNLTKIRDYYDIDMTVSYEFGLNKPTPGAPPTASKEGKDGKGGGDVSKDMTSKEVAKKMMAFNLLDGLKLTFGVNNVTNAKPPFIVSSPDSSNTDVSIYDPYQRYYYIVVSKKF